MTTFRHGVAVLVALAACTALPAAAQADDQKPGVITDPPGAIRASFDQRSYPQGAVAHLVVWKDVPRATLQLFHAGPESTHARGDDMMVGVPVGPAHSVRPGKVAVQLGLWPSGVYFARLTAGGGRIGYAPFVLRPLLLGLNRVAIVIGTNTWEAYNLRDTDGDGVGNSWYASAAVHEVDISRPYLNDGVPPHYRGYNAGFLNWAAHTDRHADYLSDDDLERFTSGRQLAALYDLVVFSGHEEYVTSHVYDIFDQYRNLGGNLMFLSANNFFYKVFRTGNILHGRWRWRDLNRPEAALIGAQYVTWDQNTYPNRPYVVVGTKRAPWLFRGTGLRDGQRLGTSYGIEIDHTTARSPPGTEVLAAIPNIFGLGNTAEMTYYETPRGAKVFDAGTINFGGATASRPLLDNLWAQLSRP